MDVLRNLKASGISCIYISHKLDEVFAISDRIVILRDGHYISEYTKADGYRSTEIIEDMIGRKIDVMYPSMKREIGGEVLRIEGFRVPHPSAPGKNIIEDASFALRKGEILGLAGLVGSGRSEWQRSFLDYSKDPGSIFMEGREISINSPEDAKAFAS